MNHCHLKSNSFFVSALLAISLLLYFCQTAQAELPTKLDSLQAALKGKILPAQKINTLYELSNTYYNNADFKTALRYNEILLEEIAKQGTKADSAKAMRHIGLVLLELSWYDRALTNLMEAQQLYKQLGDEAKTATTTMNLGLVHDYMGNIPMALFYYDKAYDDFKAKNNELGMANCMINTAIIHIKDKKYQKACDELNSAASIYQKLNNKNYLAAAYANLGIVYRYLNNFKLAHANLDKAYHIYEKNNSLYNMCANHINRGNLYIMTNTLPYAKQEYDKALAILQKTPLPDQAKDLYFGLSNYYSKLNRFEKAYEYFKMGKDIHDSINNSQMLQKVSDVQYKYEIAKRDNETNKLQKQNLDKELKLVEKNQFLVVLSALLILLTSLGVFILWQYRIKQKTAKALSEKNQLIETQKDELLRLNASKDKFFSILAHDIKNPVGTICEMGNMLNERYDSFTEDDRKVFLSDIQTLGSNLKDIVGSLLSWSLGQRGMITYHPKEFHIAELNERVVKNFKPVAKRKNIEIKVNDKDNPLVLADDHMIESVLNNLLTNAIKFSHLNSEININVLKSGSKAEISIADKGIGISPEGLKKMFSLDEPFTRKGTAGESGTGMGMILCKDFVEKNGGTVSVVSQRDEGTCITFTLPLAQA